MSGRIRLIGVPLDLGAGRRGVDMGPSALRIAGIARELKSLGFDVVDDGNVTVPQYEAEPTGDPGLRFLQPIAEVCRTLYELCRDAALDGAMPVEESGTKMPHTRTRLDILLLPAGGSGEFDGRAPERHERDIV